MTQHYHIKLNEAEMIKRLVRSLTGCAVALVCGGAGTRGFSYIGVYKALRELNIPIETKH